ncbi:MAG: hypothetical protein KGI90_01030 [Burkholderiales bacterium]|nr:hypothetical protein [Burkholderiales bacterium]MDE2277279.1 hypothetical protein [Burkholderiales bacterium]
MSKALPVAAPAVPPAPATLAEQQADFTAEGAPPPGLVSTRRPAPDSVPVRPGIKPKRATRARYP